MKQFSDLIVRVLTLFILLISCSFSAEGQKLKVEDLVQKHIESIGDNETLLKSAARSVWGSGIFRIIVGGDGSLTGTASLLSEGRKLRFSLDFDYPQYPGERITYDNKKIRVSRILPSGRSPLGNFLYTYNQIVREGLLGSSLSTAWPLLDTEGRRAKLKYRGLKKIDGKKLHRLSYSPRKGGAGIKIYLYFDPETFRHVRTEYNVLNQTGIRSNRNLATATEDTYTSEEFILTETFGEFRNMDGLILPTLWSLRYIEQRREGVNPNSSGLVVEYIINLQNVSHGPSANPAVFVVSENPDAFQKQE